MGIIAWIVVGAIAGWITNMIMGSGGVGVLATIFLGIIGAGLGGVWAGTVLGVADVTGINITSIIVAVIGAVIVVAVYRAVMGRRGAAVSADRLRSIQAEGDMAGPAVEPAPGTAPSDRPVLPEGLVFADAFSRFAAYLLDGVVRASLTSIPPATLGLYDYQSTTSPPPPMPRATFIGTTI